MADNEELIYLKKSTEKKVEVILSQLLMRLDAFLKTKKKPAISNENLL
jgi:hypothetical protein